MELVSYVKRKNYKRKMYRSLVIPL